MIHKYKEIDTDSDDKVQFVRPALPEVRHNL